MIARNKEQPLPDSEQLRKSLPSESVARDYWEARDYDKLEELYLDELLMLVGVLGPSHPELAHTFIQLARVSSARGDHRHAIEVYQKAWRVLKANGLEDSFTMALTYNLLGNAYSEDEKHDKGFECHEKALKIYQDLGAEEKVANSYNNLGETLRRKGDFAKARQYLELGLEEALELFGPKDFQTAVSYGNLGKLQVQEGQIEEALGNLNKTKRIFLKLLGPKHPHTKKTQRWINRAKKRQAKAAITASAK